MTIKAAAVIADRELSESTNVALQDRRWWQRQQEYHHAAATLAIGIAVKMSVPVFNPISQLIRGHAGD